jgi:hypothetical protein
MYITREDFQQRLFEGEMRAAFPHWNIRFVWRERAHTTYIEMPIKTEVRTVPFPLWEAVGPESDAPFYEALENP